jgi:hypothetical protein
VRLLRLTRRYNPFYWREDPLLADAQLRALGLEVREVWEGLLATVRETLELPLPLAGEIRRRYFPRAALAAGLLYLVLRLLGRAQSFGTLLSGVENKTLETNRALEKLAVRIRSDPILAETFERHEAGELWTALEEQPSGRAFLDELRVFWIATDTAKR